MSASEPTRKRPRMANAQVRKQLASLVRRARGSPRFTKKRPTEWNPRSVRNPEGVLDQWFTSASAWDFIASRLESGEEVEVIELQHPPGAKGYVMRIDLEPGMPQLYIKLELGPSQVFGRSFHYSKSQ